jgi:hypothetical protein
MDGARGVDPTARGRQNLVVRERFRHARRRNGVAVILEVRASVGRLYVGDLDDIAYMNGSKRSACVQCSRVALE